MVFGCISKNFPENIFWCLEKKKENTNEGKNTSHNAGKNRPTTAPSIAIDGAIAISPSSRDRDQRRDRDLHEFAPSIAISIRCDLAKARSRSTARSRSSRDCAVDRDLDPLREIAINGVARSRTGDRDQRRRGIDGLEIADADWRSWTGDRDQRRRDRGLEIAIEHARALSLSLSHFPETV